jgi:hypothetical protein
MRNLLNLTFFLYILVFSMQSVLTATEPNPVRKESEKEWGKPVEGQAISIETNGVEFAPEDRIVLTVRYKNVGQKSVATLLTGNEFDMYDIRVLLPDGTETPKTLYGKLQSGESSSPQLPRNGDSVSFTQSGEENSLSGIPLSRYFDFSCDGTYRIIVKQLLDQRGKNGESLRATSNTLKITVSENAEKGKRELKSRELKELKGKN